MKIKLFTKIDIFLCKQLSFKTIIKKLLAQFKNLSLDNALLNMNLCSPNFSRFMYVISIDHKAT